MQHTGQVRISPANQPLAFELSVDGELFAYEYALLPAYPETVTTAYSAVMSVDRLPTGKFDARDPRKQIDTSRLHKFVRAQNEAGDPSVNLGALVTAQNEVIKDLIQRLEDAERRIDELENLTVVQAPVLPAARPALR